MTLSERTILEAAVTRHRTTAEDAARRGDLTRACDWVAKAEAIMEVLAEPDPMPMRFPSRPASAVMEEAFLLAWEDRTDNFATNAAIARIARDVARGGKVGQ